MAECATRCSALRLLTYSPCRVTVPCPSSNPSTGLFLCSISLSLKRTRFTTLRIFLILRSTSGVLLGTIGAIWTGGIRERFADERMSNNETETARANADAAQADARAADVNLELARLKAPRTLGGEQQKRLITYLKPFAGQTFSLNVVADTEPLSLMSMIKTVLASAGWVNIPSQIGDIEVGGAGIAYGTAVELQMPRQGNPEAWERAKLFASALTAEGIVASAKLNSALKDPQAINVMIGRKP